MPEKIKKALHEIGNFYLFSPERFNLDLAARIPSKGYLFCPNAKVLHTASNIYLDGIMNQFKSKGAADIARLINLDEKLTSDLMKLHEVMDKKDILTGFPEFTTLALLSPIEKFFYRVEDVKYFIKDKKNVRMSSYDFLNDIICRKFGNKGILFLAGLAGFKI